MIHRSVREWEYLGISEAGGTNTVTRPQANRLLATAHRSEVAFGAAGAEGPRILIDSHRSLRAQQVVGVLAAPRVSLEILPKIDGLDEGKTRSNLVRMLARTFDLSIAPGDLTLLGWQSRDLLEILIRVFCDKLFQAVHRGLPRRYVLQEGDMTAFRGRLNAKRQFTILATTPQRLACLYSELVTNIAINQILKAAVSRLRFFARAPENQQRLLELSCAFAEVATIPTCILPWDRVEHELDRTNTAFRELLVLAQLILGKRFQTTTTGTTLGFSLVFEMNTLFEEYIGRTLRRALRPTNFSVTLQRPRSYALVDIKTNKSRFMTKPDIVIHLDGRPIMIVDTKWKRLSRLVDDGKHGVSQSDVYQMMAYAQIYGVRELMLLYPHHGELGVEEGILSENKIVGTENSWLRIGTISLNDLDNVPTQCRCFVSRILKTVH